jgi:hypothetical protein
MKLIIMILYIALPLVALITLYKRHTIKEDKFLLKWFGYYVLGAFSLTVNQFIMPLGFLIYLFFLRNPKQNKGLKRSAAILGLIFFLVQLTSPAIEEKWYERPHEVQGEEGNLYEFSFQKVWEKVVQEFEIPPSSAKLNKYEIEYRKDGLISTMEFEIVDTHHDEFIHYNISYNPNDLTFIIKRFKTDPWLQYNRLISVSHYFSSLDSLDIQKLTMNHDFSSYILEGEGERGSYAVQNWDNYVVEHDRIKKVQNYELPIEGYLLRFFGKYQDSFDSKYIASYYFDATYSPKETGPYSAQDAIAVLRGEKRVDTWMEDHYGNEIRKQENGRFYREYQGKWQQVSEEEYHKKIEPFNRTQELHNQEWHITFEAKFGDPPYILKGVFSRETGEIIAISTK